MKNTIFIVDDDWCFRNLCELLFTDLGYRVVLFESAEEALNKIPAAELPDLLMVDFSLPRINGEELLRDLRLRLPELKRSSRVVGFSSHRPGGELTAQFEAIADEYLEKPSDIDDLARLVERLVPRSQ